MIIPTEFHQVAVGVTRPGYSEDRVDTIALFDLEDFQPGDYVDAVYKYLSDPSTLTTSTRLDSCPKSVFITHKQPCFNKDNEVIGFQYIEIFRAKSDANFEKAYSEKSPYAPSLNFEVEDPERPDGKLVDEKFEPLAEGLNYFDLIADNQ